MTHASLFSGIGGFDLAAEWIGWNNIFHCEWNPFGQKVLAHHFPNSKSYNDITKTDFTIQRGQIDVLTGGFPCQPYSSAGKRLGKADERHLFPHMLRCVKEVKPKYVIGENVRGLVNWNGGLVFHEVQDDLEREGYEVQSFLIPAASVNAPHQRYRIWFVAYCKDFGCKSTKTSNKWQEHIQNDRNGIRTAFESNGEIWDVTNSDTSRLHKQHFASESIEKNEFSRASFEKRDFASFPTKPPICGGNDGIPRELDSITFSKWRNQSIKAYGNAIVPQVAFEIFKTIQSFEDLVNVY
jgi:DNA (cytosine-5)-methyltransferase 1